MPQQCIYCGEECGYLKRYTVSGPSKNFVGRVAHYAWRCTKQQCRKWQPQGTEKAVDVVLEEPSTSSAKCSKSQPHKFNQSSSVHRPPSANQIAGSLPRLAMKLVKVSNNLLEESSNVWVPENPASCNDLGSPEWKQCTLCDFRAHSDSLLSCHVRRRHSNMIGSPTRPREPSANHRFACDQCDFRSAHSWSVARHKREEHGGSSRKKPISPTNRGDSLVAAPTVVLRRLEDQLDLPCVSKSQESQLIARTLLGRAENDRPEPGEPTANMGAQTYSSVVTDIGAGEQMKKCKLCNYKTVKVSGIERHLLSRHSIQSDILRQNLQEFYVDITLNDSTAEASKVAPSAAPEAPAPERLAFEQLPLDAAPPEDSQPGPGEGILDEALLRSLGLWTDVQISPNELGSDPILSDNPTRVSVGDFAPILFSPSSSGNNASALAGEDPSMISCSQCSYKAYKRRTVEKHERFYHSETSTSLTEPPACSSENVVQIGNQPNTESLANMVDLRMTKRVSDLPDCDALTQPDAFEMALSMQKERSEKCPFCEFSAYRRQTVEKHVRLVHDGAEISSSTHSLISETKTRIQEVDISPGCRKGRPKKRPKFAPRSSSVSSLREVLNSENGSVKEIVSQPVLKSKVKHQELARKSIESGTGNLRMVEKVYLRAPKTSLKKISTAKTETARGKGKTLNRFERSFPGTRKRLRKVSPKPPSELSDGEKKQVSSPLNLNLRVSPKSTHSSPVRLPELEPTFSTPVVDQLAENPKLSRSGRQIKWKSGFSISSILRGQPMVIDSQSACNMPEHLDVKSSNTIGQKSPVKASHLALTNGMTRGTKTTNENTVDAEAANENQRGAKPDEASFSWHFQSPLGNEIMRVLPGTVTRRLFSCKLCEYTTIYPKDARRHIVRHENGSILPGTSVQRKTPPKKEGIPLVVDEKRAIAKSPMRNEVLPSAKKAVGVIKMASKKRKLSLAMTENSEFGYGKDSARVEENANSEESAVPNRDDRINQACAEKRNMGVQKCNLCPFESAYVANLKRHIARKHKKQRLTVKISKKFPCSICSFCAATWFRLKLHMRQEHAKAVTGQPKITDASDAMLECALCSFKSPFLMRFRQHMQKKHGKQELAIACGSSTPARQDVAALLESSINCSICKQLQSDCSCVALSGQTVVNESARFEGVKGFPCRACGDVLPSRSHLRLHKIDCIEPPFAVMKSHVTPKKSTSHVIPKKSANHVWSEESANYVTCEEGANHVRSEEGADHVTSEESTNHVKSEESANHVTSEESTNHVTSEEIANHVKSEERADIVNSENGAEIDLDVDCQPLINLLQPGTSAEACSTLRNAEEMPPVTFASAKSDLERKKGTKRDRSNGKNLKHKMQKLRQKQTVALTDKKGKNGSEGRKKIKLSLKSEAESSEFKSPSSRKKHNAAIWMYYTKLHSQDDASSLAGRCKLCGTEIAYLGSNADLWRHFIKKHRSAGEQARIKPTESTTIENAQITKLAYSQRYSAVWSHFQPLDLLRSRCSHCAAVVNSSTNGGTGPHWHHLKHRHPQEYKQSFIPRPGGRRTARKGFERRSKMPSGKLKQKAAAKISVKVKRKPAELPAVVSECTNAITVTTEPVKTRRFSLSGKPRICLSPPPAKTVPPKRRRTSCVASVAVNPIYSPISSASAGPKVDPDLRPAPLLVGMDASRRCDWLLGLRGQTDGPITAENDEDAINSDWLLSRLEDLSPDELVPLCPSAPEPTPTLEPGDSVSNCGSSLEASEQVLVDFLARLDSAQLPVPPTFVIGAARELLSWDDESKVNADWWIELQRKHQLSLTTPTQQWQESAAAELFATPESVSSIVAEELETQIKRHS